MAALRGELSTLHVELRHEATAGQRAREALAVATDRIVQLEEAGRRTMEIERRQAEGNEAVAVMAAAMRETEARLTAAEAAAAAAAERAQLAEEGRAVAERATDEARRQSTRAVEAARGASEMQVQTLQRDAEQREAALRQWAAGLQAECTEQGRAALRNDRDAADAHAAAMREQQTAHAAVTSPCASLLMVFRMEPFVEQPHVLSCDMVVIHAMPAHRRRPSLMASCHAVCAHDANGCDDGADGDAATVTCTDGRAAEPHVATVGGGA